MSSEIEPSDGLHSMTADVPSLPRFLRRRVLDTGGTSDCVSSESCVSSERTGADSVFETSSELRGRDPQHETNSKKNLITRQQSNNLNPFSVEKNNYTRKKGRVVGGCGLRVLFLVEIRIYRGRRRHSRKRKRKRNSEFVGSFILAFLPVLNMEKAKRCDVCSPLKLRMPDFRCGTRVSL